MANESAIEVVARWIEEGGPGVNLASTRRLMADTVRSLAAPAPSTEDGGVLMPEGLRRYACGTTKARSRCGKSLVSTNRNTFEAHTLERGRLL